MIICKVCGEEVEIISEPNKENPTRGYQYRCPRCDPSGMNMVGREGVEDAYPEAMGQKEKKDYFTKKLREDLEEEKRTPGSQTIWRTKEKPKIGW